MEESCFIQTYLTPDTVRLLFQPCSANIYSSIQVNSETKQKHKQHVSLVCRESSFYAGFRITLSSLILKQTNNQIITEAAWYWGRPTRQLHHSAVNSHANKSTTQISKNVWRMWTFSRLPLVSSISLKLSVEGPSRRQVRVIWQHLCLAAFVLGMAQASGSNGCSTCHDAAHTWQTNPALVLAALWCSRWP